MTSEASDTRDALAHAQVLVEIGELAEAELALAAAIEAAPDDLAALSLLAKVKHIRGELTRAVACWAEIHRRSLGGEPALRHLGSMLHMAQDPRQAGREFVALGSQLVRKPAAYRELEDAFRLLLENRPKEALAHCAEVERRHRAQGGEVYKLAVLARAWIAEMMGDLDGACAALEGLGRERGFANDTDRILALASLYERIGTKERLEAAANVCHFLERANGGVPVLGRLALVYRRLGLLDLAREYEALHLRAFRRAMHRPSFEDVVRTAARRYLPLARLAAIELAEAPGEPPAEASGRERAIARALGGDRAAAVDALRAGDEPIDWKYLADLAALEGDLPRATDLYLRAARADPEDLHVVAWLLDRFAEVRSPAIAAFFGEQGPRLEARLDRAVRAEPRDARAWRRLATLLAARPDAASRAPRAAARATALEQAARRLAAPVGRVMAAAVYHFAGSPVGVIHEIWTGREPAPPGRGGTLPRGHVLGSLTDEMKASVRSCFLAVREYARAKMPHLTAAILEHDYSYRVTKDDEPSGGASAGLPSALAFLSTFLDRPVARAVASTGVVVADAHDVIVLGGVGEIEHKVAAAYHRNMEAIIVPAANRPEIEGSSLVPPAVSRAIVRYAATLDDAARLVFGEEIFL
jgi:tetratricopeptide (TPR) repeat protein